MWLAAVSFAAEAARPNIVVILADDMGFSDIGCYGGEIETPNIDRLAKEGLRFTQFYNTSRCCPTRASLLTGLYPHQAGIGHMTDDYAIPVRAKLGGPGYEEKLNNRCVTIAEVLGASGYETFMSGKWHVGNAREAWPDRRGFSRSFCVVSGAMNYYGSGIQHAAGPLAMQLQLDGELWNPPTEEFFSTDAFTDRAVQFVRERKDPSRPFFLYLAYNAPHWPLHALPEDIAKYRGKYREGFEKVRATRLQRQISSGLFSAGTPLPPLDEASPVWDGISEAQRDEWDLRMAIYAAQVDAMDRGVGRVLETLRNAGADENTLVLFLSDNGACHERIDRGQAGALLGERDSYSSYRRPWAQVSNTPFRFYKHWTHEGGIRTPLIARWPAVVKRAGGYARDAGHVIDIMATAVDAAGAGYPAKISDRAIAPMEGTSLLAALKGEPLIRTPPLFWEHEGNRAVRDGKWKLVSAFPAGWELYDLEADRTETRNLADQNPEKVQELTAKYDQWAERCFVRPWELTKAGEK